jgi:hypothetical protein
MHCVDLVVWTQQLLGESFRVFKELLGVVLV